ncbi:MAG: thiol reductase thioredoxin [Planctomycetes bacterium]|nr:thiol reductase thioredoxin [Planctomycetota bacterium]
MLEQLQSELAGKVKALKVDIMQEMDLGSQYGITALPTVLLFKAGKIEKQWIGLTKKDVLKAKVEQLG